MPAFRFASVSVNLRAGVIRRPAEEFLDLIRTLSFRRRGAREVHPLVGLDYIIRIVGYPIGACVVVSARVGESTSPAFVWSLVAFALVWPQLAYWIGRYAKDPKQTEYFCLMLDCALCGAAASLVSFRLLPSAMLATGVLTAITSIGGLPLFTAGLTVLGVAWAIGLTVTDWSLMKETPLIAVALSLVGAFLFQWLLAMQTFRQAKALVKSRHQIASQAEQILEQNEALESAMRQS